jgi:hypothetical protein
MKKILGLCLVMGLVGWSATSHSKVLWQNTQTGMSVSQVEKIFPQAKQTEPRYETMLGDGSQRLLEIKNYKINIYYYDAEFYFNRGKLTQVTLALQDDQPIGAALEALTDAFRVKYGKEVTSREDRFSMEKKWLTKDKTIVKLSVHGRYLTVIYHARDELDLNKL